RHPPPHSCAPPPLHSLTILLTSPRPTSALFPYTTLFRSRTMPSCSARSCSNDTSGACKSSQRPDIRRLLGGRSAKYDKLNSRSRSEEHTSELQSRENLVCRLLLEKKR